MMVSLHAFLKQTVMFCFTDCYKSERATPQTPPALPGTRLALPLEPRRRSPTLRELGSRAEQWIALSTWPTSIVDIDRNETIQFYKLLITSILLTIISLYRPTDSYSL